MHKYEKVFTISQTLTVKWTPLPPKGISAYCCHMVSPDAPKKIWEGICPTDALPTPENLRPQSEWLMCRLSDLAYFARWGYAGKNNDFSKWDKMPTDPFTILSNPKRSEKHKLIQDDHNSHMIFDAAGQPLPVAMTFGYAEGFADDRLDLAMAHKQIQKHPHVKDLSKIYKIPVFDVYDNHTQGLSFIWTPDEKTYRKAWKWCLTAIPEYPSTGFADAIFALDLLGLKKCLENG